jgi:hypothetical protein
MSEEELVEWKADDPKFQEKENSGSIIEKFSKKKRRRGSQHENEEELEEKTKRKISNEESNQIIVSDAINLTEEDKRKCK